MKELEALLTLPNSKILSGNTSKHVEKYYQKVKAQYDNIIDISTVQELHMTSSDGNNLKIGSSVSIQTFLNLVASIPANSINIEKIKSALAKVGSVSMREQESDHQNYSRTFSSMKRTNLVMTRLKGNSCRFALFAKAKSFILFRYFRHSCLFQCKYHHR